MDDLLGELDWDNPSPTAMILEDWDHRGGTTYIDNGEEFIAWYFGIIPSWENVFLKKIKLEQIGTLNWEDFDDVYIKLHKNWITTTVWSCELSLSERCTMNLNIWPINSLNRYDFTIETEVDSEEQETVQLKISELRVEDSHGKNVNVNWIPRILNTITEVQKTSVNNSVSCATEWEIENTQTSNFECCNWLSRFEYWRPGWSASPMCYEANNWTPTCTQVWTSQEWRYYPNWSLLMLDNECDMYTN